MQNACIQLNQQLNNYLAYLRDEKHSSANTIQAYRRDLEKFFDFAVDIVRYVFSGNQPFVEGTPKGDAILALFRKIRPFVKTLKGAQGETLDFYQTMKHTAGNYSTDDYNAVIKLK